VPGELLVGGAGLARGYLGRPELTAEKFIPDPFGGEPGGRLYRTGDLVRWRADGEVDFLGRIDDQVKVRGFRIELGEVEAALRAVAGVADAAVTAQAERLVAYVAGTPGAAELREALRRRLPEHLVPSVFVALDKLPLSPSGKVDRRALPAPENLRPAEREYTAPRNELERQLAEMVAELLELEQVGVHDSFFELGGHSLLATRLISKIREDTGVELPLRTLFETPTVAQLADAHVRAQALEKNDVAPAPAITALSRDAYRVRRSALQ
jgi:acyl carrier protein